MLHFMEKKPSMTAECHCIMVQTLKTFFSNKETISNEINCDKVCQKE